MLEAEAVHDDPAFAEDEAFGAEPAAGQQSATGEVGFVRRYHRALRHAEGEGVGRIDRRAEERTGRVVRADAAVVAEAVQDGIGGLPGRGLTV